MSLGFFGHEKCLATENTEDTEGKKRVRNVSHME